MSKDIYQECTDTIIKVMENNPKQWESGLSGLISDMPIRSNNEYYKGINIILLNISASKQGFASNQWLTYKQAQSVGGNVRKGEKGTGIVFYKSLVIKD